ncbi:carboxylesterase/lipase family protein [Parvularcula flava]|uniref:Carboxylic ester hydrolase n=1 Tax=Aquisalinus luteolus TaxID=1566827 RepID=A0A8J3ESY7_9PROT|nr:carboxylesterase/lipase family protein [Aquisalinus luteolus]NHK26438.1 carboxylesterase/lipase family protein [Aquisalinus luteolus]GGH92334.1 carboxylic ester hydrolase [Aquisalinus luteolus]
MPNLATPSRRLVLKGTLAAGAAGLSLGTAAHAQTRPVVETAHGKVRGRRQGGVSSFLGIRYGASTEGRRFQAPIAPEAWDGIMDATAYGPSSPQGRTDEETSEDCLFLNVWTRETRTGRNRPVLVYFHGGAYAHGSGSSPLYDGTSLVERGDVVIVTVNHRLNVFGYGYFNRLGAPESWADSGNAGQLDLILSLNWVRNNIARFGGDPDKVTVFGQSGGGAKIATLMAMPDVDGLFHHAWTMSGQQVTASGPLNATQRSRAFLDELGLAVSDIDRLSAMPMSELVGALSATDPVFGNGSVYFGPTLDFRSLKRHPFYPDAPQQSAHIPMVLGNTKDETRAFLGGNPDNHTLTWEELPDALAPQMRVDILPEYVVEKYRELFPDYTPSEVFFAATTAGRSWRGQVIEADERAKQDTATWVYQLDWPVDDKVRAPHTLDIPLVFDTTHVEGALSGNSPEARKLAALMSESLLSFASAGNPNHAALPEWGKYTLPDRRTMVFDLPPHAEDDPRKAERELFDTVPYVQPGT